MNYEHISPNCRDLADITTILVSQFIALSYDADIEIEMTGRNNLIEWPSLSDMGPPDGEQKKEQ